MSRKISIGESLEIVSACADEFGRVVADFLYEWESEEPPLPLTVLFSDIGSKFCAMSPKMSRSDRKVFLDCIESLLRNGCDEVVGAAATGFWESVLAESSQDRFDFLEIATLLGPRSASHCIAWDNFTGCTTPGLTR